MLLRAIGWSEELRAASQRDEERSYATAQWRRVCALRGVRRVCGRSHCACMLVPLAQATPRFLILPARVALPPSTRAARTQRHSVEFDERAPRRRKHAANHHAHSTHLARARIPARSVRSPLERSPALPSTPSCSTPLDCILISDGQRSPRWIERAADAQ